MYARDAEIWIPGFPKGTVIRGLAAIQKHYAKGPSAPPDWGDWEPVRRTPRYRSLDSFKTLHCFSVEGLLELC
jgi:hypothetical protein